MEHLSCQVKAKDSFTKGFNRSKFNEFNAKKKMNILALRKMFGFGIKKKKEKGLKSKIAGNKFYC